MIPPGAHCATHPDEDSDAICSRCGDFMCALCGPLVPVPVCARCLLRATVDWEERGEISLSRAFLSTARECITSPSKVGARLGGFGHGFSALTFAALSALVGALPLALVFDAVLLSVSDTELDTFRGMSVLTLSAVVAIASIAYASLLPVLLALWASFLWSFARALGAHPSYETLLRAGCYGTSPCALPLLGPLLAPLAVVQQGLLVRAVLTRDGMLSGGLSFVCTLLAWLVPAGLVVATALALVG